MILLGLVPLLCSRAVVAADSAQETTSIHWTAPSECPQQASVEAEIERLLGEPVGASRAQKLTFDAHLQRRDQRYEVNVVVYFPPDGQQARSLSDPDCVRLTEAAALIMALAIDPERVHETARAQTEPQASPVRREAPAVAERPQRTVSPAQREPAREPGSARPPQIKATSRPSYLVDIGPIAALGPLPGLSLGLDLRAGIAMQWLEADLVLDGFLPHTESVPGFSEASVGARLLSAGARGCVVPLRSTLVLSACAGAQLGLFTGFGEAVVNARNPNSGWSALLAGFGARTGWRGLVFRAGIEAGPALARPAFGATVDGRFVEVFRSSAWLAQAHGGLGLRF